MRMHLSAIAALASAGAASAAISNGGLKILAPGGDNLWWLVGMGNNIVWTCGESTFSQFTVSINNSDISLLTDIQAIISQEQNFNCDQLVTPNDVNVPVGDGYTIVLADPLNGTNVYAVSDPFSVKPVSVGYPPASATPSDPGAATIAKPTGSGSGSVVGATGAATGSGSAAPQKTGAGMRLSAGVAAAALGVAAVTLSLL
ncbi:hypothetical protein GGX14DRAFT_636801 [Mycena pura]|uniref:GPI anchored protein n=1 Tax=Mycena pura TaxID=153505 RepID=A0AAD6VE86_9AGAR|nr:hypothetical protein GGX14DRAFT_636801 [Mycena pura]